jgi:hypothetical protein
MNQKNIIPLILSTIAGALAALAVCAFFFFYYNRAQPAEKPKQLVEKEPTPTPKLPETPEMQTEKVKLSDINSVVINTVYTGFYDAGSECAKGLYPNPKPDDTIALSYSPCRTVLTFNRNGDAAKTLTVKRRGKTANEPETVEKSEWKSKITDEQFEALLKGIAGNQDFIQWQSVMITHSNCTIYAYHTKGTAQIPLYIDIKKGSTMEPAVNAFKELDKKVVWKKV